MVIGAEGDPMDVPGTAAIGEESGETRTEVEELLVRSMLPNQTRRAAKTTATVVAAKKGPLANTRPLVDGLSAVRAPKTVSHKPGAIGQTATPMDARFYHQTVFVANAVVITMFLFMVICRYAANGIDNCPEGIYYTSLEEP